MSDIPTTTPLHWIAILQKIKGNPNYQFSEELLHNQDFIQLCLNHTDFSYTRVPKDIFENHRDIAYTIIKKQKYSAEKILNLFSLENYSLDKDIMFYFIKNSTSFYKYADPSLFSDREFCLLLTKTNFNNAEACHKISPHFFDEKDFALEIAPANPFAIRFLSGTVLKDLEVLRTFQEHHNFFFVNIAPQHYKDVDISVEVFKFIFNIPETQFETKDFILHRLISMIEETKLFPDFFKTLDLESPPLEILKNIETLYSHLQMENDLNNHNLSATLSTKKVKKF